MTLLRYCLLRGEGMPVCHGLSVVRVGVLWKLVADGSGWRKP